MFALCVHPTRTSADDGLPENYSLKYAVSIRILPQYHEEEKPVKIMEHLWTRQIDSVPDRIAIDDQKQLEAKIVCMLQVQQREAASKLPYL